ncbi:hypothetical protein ABT115_15625 [Streptomyces sp. NPDC001832]|uniref:hypothetical protein n=1 Tax=Streptomyces sp. NPDC001832 TaxID=3154527 RepID=UPI003331D4FC
MALPRTGCPRDGRPVFRTPRPGKTRGHPHSPEGGAMRFVYLLGMAGPLVVLAVLLIAR